MRFQWIFVSNINLEKNFWRASWRKFEAKVLFWSTLQRSYYQKRLCHWVVYFFLKRYSRQTLQKYNNKSMYIKHISCASKPNVGNVRDTQGKRVKKLVDWLTVVKDGVFHKKHCPHIFHNFAENTDKSIIYIFRVQLESFAGKLTSWQYNNARFSYPFCVEKLVHKHLCSVSKFALYRNVWIEKGGSIHVKSSERFCLDEFDLFWKWNFRKFIKKARYICFAYLLCKNFYKKSYLNKLKRHRVSFYRFRKQQKYVLLCRCKSEIHHALQPTISIWAPSRTSKSSKIRPNGSTLSEFYRKPQFRN